MEKSRLIAKEILLLAVKYIEKEMTYREVEDKATEKIKGYSHYCPMKGNQNAS